jgi:hypothetical protein
MNHEFKGCSRYEGVSKSFRTGSLERELRMVQLSTSRCSCIAILWVSLVSFAAITLRVFIVVVCFVIGSVRKHLDTSSCLLDILQKCLKFSTPMEINSCIEKWIPIPIKWNKWTKTCSSLFGMRWAGQVVWMPSEKEEANTFPTLGNHSSYKQTC